MVVCHLLPVEEYPSLNVSLYQESLYNWQPDHRNHDQVSDSYNACYMEKVFVRNRRVRKIGIQAACKQANVGRGKIACRGWVVERVWTDDVTEQMNVSAVYHCPKPIRLPFLQRVQT